MFELIQERNHVEEPEALGVNERGKKDPERGVSIHAFIENLRAELLARV